MKERELDPNGSWPTAESLQIPAAAEELWKAMRGVETELGESPPDEWLVALRSILTDRTRPGAWGGIRGEASGAYLDDTGSAGWVLSSIAKSLRRIAAARTQAGLTPNLKKCKVMTTLPYKCDVHTLLEPLRRRDPNSWPVVTSMKILGIEVVDPSDPALVTAAVKKGLEERVIRPCKMLMKELRAGARPSTAYWVYKRYVEPNAVFYANIYGLFAEAECWIDTDAALDELCMSLAPKDLRAHISRSELALPQRHGGLGIPVLSALSAHMAASQKPFKTYQDAVDAGMKPSRATIAYKRDVAADEYTPVGLEAYYATEIAALNSAVPAGERSAWNRRREQNELRAGSYALNSVPWEEKRSLTHMEWDVLWRLRFGGMSDETKARIDHPPRGHTFRGSRVEEAVMDAIEDVLPPGCVRLWSQPSPEYEPPDHEARCIAAGITLDGWKRADIMTEYRPGATVTLDVSAIHLQCNSRMQRKVDAQIRSVEDEKNGRYAAYYAKFRPLVVSLSGAVSDTAFGAIKEITRLSSRATGPRLDWEKYRWAVEIVQRVAIATVKATALDATRVPCMSRVGGTRGERRSWRAGRTGAQRRSNNMA